MKEWLDYLRNLNLRARWSLGVGACAVLVLTCVLVWWAARPVYSPLYTDLSDQDMGQIVAALDKWHVPYRYGHDGGSIEVPDASVADARMRLATEGVPSHGTVGLEIFDNADYGMTEFAQKVNYQRAIQGELERTIMALKEVKFARVHITMKQADLFIKDEEAPKASVTIAVHEGERLLPAQISGIQHLVAAAVAGLDPKSVIVVDDRGEALTGANDASNGAADMDARLQEQVKIENALKQKISGLLATSLGMNDASVSVSVMLNFDQVKHTEQKVLVGPDGNGYVLHKQETDSDPTSASTDAAGKPATKKTTLSSSVDYENGKSYEEVEYAQGRIERISVGIIVPGVLPADQQQRLRDVIAAAAGLNAARGDEIQLTALLPTQTTFKSPALAHSQQQTVPVEAQTAGAQFALPQQIKWAALLLLIILGLMFMGRSLLKNRTRLSPEKREAVLLEIRRWLGETGK